MKNILVIVKKVIMSYVILYGYNLIAVNFNMVIPINVITISLITLLGVPSLLALLLLRIMII